jgi:thiamine biosynthesis lipoprotein
MDWVHLDADNFTVQFERSGVQVDLGAVGKGYALEIANEVLREAGVASALIHGGTSSVCAIGTPLDGEFWNIAIEHPDTAVPDHERIVAMAKLQDESFSLSAGWGKAFEENGVSYGHVMDPGLGQPVQNALLAAVALSGGTASDAWSTALLVAGAAGAAALGKASVGSRSLIMLPSSESGYRLTNDGFDLPQR